MQANINVLIITLFVFYVLFTLLGYVKKKGLFTIFKKQKRGKPLKNDQNGQQNNYRMVFSLKENNEKAISFYSSIEALSRNEALRKYFIQENNKLVLIGNIHEFVFVDELVACRLEQVEQNRFLFDLPEEVGSGVTNVFEIPETVDNVSEERGNLLKNESISLDPEELKELRSEAQLTQKSLGSLVAIDGRRISKIERGVVKATEDEMQRLTDYFGLSKGRSCEKLSSEIIESEKKAPKIDYEEFYASDEEILETDINTSEKSNQKGINLKNSSFFKKKSKKETVPKGKRNVSTVWRIVAWSVVGLFVVGAGSAFIKSNRATNTVDAMEMNLTTLKDKVSSPDEQKDISGHIDTYFSEFIPLYINTYSDNSLSADRDLKLQSYFGSGFQIENPSVDRKLKSTEFYETEKNGDVQIAKYIVKYTVDQKSADLVKTEVGSGTESGIDEQENENQETISQLLSIPFEYVDGTIAIADYPYFSAVPNQLGLLDPLEKDFGDQLTADDAKPVVEFVDQFLKSYAELSAEEMKYMMNDPESLNGVYNFSKADTQVYEGKEGQFEAVTLVTFVMPDSELTHVERMQLSISKTSDGKYFVEKLNHTLGGN